MEHELSVLNQLTGISENGAQNIVNFERHKVQEEIMEAFERKLRNPEAFTKQDEKVLRLQIASYLLLEAAALDENSRHELFYAIYSLTNYIRDRIENIPLSVIEKWACDGDQQKIEEVNDFYRTQETATMHVSVTLTGRKLAEGESFTFAFMESPDNPEGAVLPEDQELVISADKDGNCSGSFQEILFRRPGTYQYIIKQIPGILEDVSYDADAKCVTVTADEYGGGTIFVSVSMGTKAHPIVFTNVCEEEEPEPHVETAETSSEDIIDSIVGLLSKLKGDNIPVEENSCPSGAGAGPVSALATDGADIPARNEKAAGKAVNASEAVSSASEEEIQILRALQKIQSGSAVALPAGMQIANSKKPASDRDGSSGAERNGGGPTAPDGDNDEDADPEGKSAPANGTAKAHGEKSSASQDDGGAQQLLEQLQTELAAAREENALLQTEKSVLQSKAQTLQQRLNDNERVIRENNVQKRELEKKNGEQAVQISEANEKLKSTRASLNKERKRADSAEEEASLYKKSVFGFYKKVKE